MSDAINHRTATPIDVSDSASGPRAAATHLAGSDASLVLLDRYLILALWLLPIMAFTQPTQALVSSWQLLDVCKLGISAYTCFGGFYVLFRNLGHPQFRRVFDPLIPFYCFLGWAVLSVFWTPLRSVTLFQGGGLAAQLFCTGCIGLLCTHRQNVSRILWHTSMSFMVSSLVVLVVYLIDPSASGLDRVRIHTGGQGMIHPTAAGATASLGLLLPVLCLGFGKFVWAKKMLLPAAIIHGAALLLSNSRTATGMAVLTIGSVLLWYSTNRQRAMVVSLAGLLALAALVVDPGFRVIGKGLGASANYVTRGQTGAQLKGVSGRAELWEAVWGEFEYAMMMGHGYFVTSREGELDVWGHQENYSAHNMLFQVLVTTGAIGLMMFVLALFQSALAIFSLRAGDESQRGIFMIALVIAVWYAGWAQLGDAFMGPVRPESLLFFVILGVGVGQAAQMRLRLSLSPQATAAS